MPKAKEYRDQSLQELESAYEDSCRKLFNLKSQAHVDKNRPAPHEYKHVRKDIARLLTVITEKQRQSKIS